MNVDACFQLGKIVRPHGTKGEALVALTPQQPNELTKKESVFVEINNKLVPFFVKKITAIPGNKAIFKFEDIESEKELDLVLNAPLYLPLTDLPKLKEGQFYYYEIIGYQVIDEQLGYLGTVSEVFEMPGQDLIEMSYKDKFVLIPINEDIVTLADHEAKSVRVNLPDGLMEVYMTEDKDQIPDDAD